MSAPGHCEHCAIEVVLVGPGSDVTEELYMCDGWQHSNSSGAGWEDECCPACDEAEHIATAIDAERARQERLPLTRRYYDGIDALSVAAKIARGEA